VQQPVLVAAAAPPDDEAAAANVSGAAAEQAHVDARQSVLEVLKGRHGVFAIQSLVIGEWAEATQVKALKLLATLLVASPDWADTVRSSAYQVCWIVGLWHSHQ
jgi:hypothetical protein